MAGKDSSGEAGPVESIIDKVKDTTRDIKQDIRDVVDHVRSGYGENDGPLDEVENDGSLDRDESDNDGPLD